MFDLAVVLLAVAGPVLAVVLAVLPRRAVAVSPVLAGPSLTAEIVAELDAEVTRRAVADAEHGPFVVGRVWGDELWSSVDSPVL